MLQRKPDKLHRVHRPSLLIRIVVSTFGFAYQYCRWLKTSRLSPTGCLEKAVGLVFAAVGGNSFLYVLGSV